MIPALLERAGNVLRPLCEASERAVAKQSEPATGSRPIAKVVRRVERSEQPEEATSPLPDDWPLHATLRDASVLLVGGDFTRDHASGHEPRAIQSFAEAIERGRFELVILLTRWLNHSASLRIVQACRGAEVRFVQTDGYSTTALQQAFEHTLVSFRVLAE